MKQFLHSYRLFLIVAALCTLSAFWLLGARIGVEQTQRQVDVVVSYEDVCALSDASGIPVQDWLTQLADAGARELLVTPAELADPDIVRAAQDAGLSTAQAGGLAQGGTYFFAARYDTLAAAGQTGIDTDTEPLAQAQVLDALRESGSTLVLIEDRNQTGCVLPDGYTLDGYTGDMVKGFWLNQTFRARYQTLGYSGAEEIVNMLYRAVVDRGMTVLWLTPLTDAAGETVAQPEVYTQLLQDLAQRIAPAGYQYGGITGIPTGLRDLDRLTAGWQRGDLHIIAARPSVGKTAFALHLALAAGRAGKQVLVNSLEMQGERLGDRWLCAQAASLDAGHLKSGQLSADEQQQALEAARQLSCLPVYVDDNPKASMDHIRSSALLQKSKGHCDLLIIDYLQLCDMKSEQKNRNREQEVAEASRKAKLIAKELDIPVILLCQLNRECEMRADKRPALSDLRESGAIEQDADVVMLLYRPALYGLTSERKSKFPSEGLGMVILAKHRNGETGDVYFGHNPTLTKIGEYEPTLEWMARNARSSC